MIIFDIPRIYYPYGCLVCLRAYEDIKRCSKCKIAVYCSKYHQISNWQYSHRHLCKVITSCDKKFTPSISNFEEWTNYRMGRRYIWEKLLKRSLNTQEILMNQFSPVCAVCYTKENLHTCKSCYSISYCSEQHELQHLDEHRMYCDSFKLGLIADQYINVKGLPDVEFNPIDKKALSSTKDILKHIKFVDFASGHNYLTEQQEILAIDILKTERITLGLNLLYALNLIECNKDKLVIHIIGASSLESESNWSVVTEILSNWMELSYVTYHFVGPDIHTNTSDKKSSNYELIYHSCLYHEIIEKIDKPDLVVAFNCGLHEFEKENENPWLLSIPKLLHYIKVPLMLTSFTEIELIRDKNILLSLGHRLRVILEVNKNPFAFLKPLRDWLSKNEPIFFRCNYIYIIERTE